MKYCNFCGAKMLDNEEKCRICGEFQNGIAEIAALPIDEAQDLAEINMQPNIELCPCCRNEIDQYSERILCPYCHSAHHKECWDAKNECSVFSCYSKRHASTSVGDINHPGIISNLKSRIIRNRRKGLRVLAGLLTICLLLFMVAGGWYFICKDPLRIIKKFINNKPEVTALSLTETGNKLAAGLNDGSVELWDIRRETPLSKVVAFDQTIDFVMFTPKYADNIVTGGNGGETKMFSTSNSAFLRTLKSGKERVQAAVCFDGGNKLAVGNDSGELAVYEVSQGAVRSTNKIHQGKILALGMDKKNIIVSVSDDKKVFVTDITTGKMLKEIALPFAPQHLTLSSDNNVVAVADNTGNIVLINVLFGKIVNSYRVQIEISALAVKKDGTVLIAGADGQISIVSNNGNIKKQFLAGRKDSGTVLALDLSESKLYTAGKSMTIKQWNLSSLKCDKAMARRDIWLENAVVSNDGTLIAIGQTNGEIKIFDADSGETVKTLIGHSDLVRSVAFSEDGKRLVSGGDDKTVKIWNLATGSSKNLKGHKGWVKSVAFSPDGKVVASGSFDSTVKIWDAETGEEEHNLTGHDAWVRDVEFSPDGKHLATCGDDKQIKIWNVATGECEKTMTGHDRWVNDVQFSDDGKQLISAGGDGTEKVWDIDTEKCLSTIQEQNDLRNSMIYAADGKMFAEKTVCAFCSQEVRPGDVIAICDNCKSPQHVTCWRENGSKCVVCGQNISKPQEIGVDFNRMYANQKNGRSEWLQKLFKTNTGSNITIFSNMKVLIFSVIVLLLLLVLIVYYFVKEPRVRTIAAHNYWIEALKFSKNGKYLASGSGDGTAKIWSARSGSFIRTLKASNYPIEAITFLGVSSVLVTVGWEKVLRLWNMEDSSNTGTLVGHNQIIYAVSSSREGNVLVSAAGDNSIRIWDVASQSCIRTIRGHIASVFGVVVSPDGSKIASCSSDRSVKIWNFDGSLSISLAGHDAAVRCLDFHPNGYLLASGSDGGDIIIWNQKTGERVKSLVGHTKRVRSLVFSHKGEMLASCGDDNTVIVWDVRSGNQIEVLKGHTDRVCAVAFSVDDKRVASGGDDRVIKIWRLKRSLRAKIN
ncbi:MAG: RING finger protein [Negativicutes bacterium]|jgi:WD40 repeat protein